MRVLEDLKISGYVQVKSQALKNLPDKAREILLAVIDSMQSGDKETLAIFLDVALNEDKYLKCESPIEKILCVALDIVTFFRLKEFSDYDFFYYPQSEIFCAEKVYRADFHFYIENCKNSEKPNYEFLVECDGYEYHHKEKWQVKRDNKRDYEIKRAGYEILHFSGTQIYENPMECANDIIDYALGKIGAER